MRIIKLPGLIDPHVHFRTPGQETKEDFTTGTGAAIAGGFTTVLDMPNNSIPITTKKLLDEKIQIAKKNILCDVGFYFGSLGDNLGEFEKIAGKVTGLKLYLNETTGNFIINKKTLGRIFKSWPKNGAPILVHAEDDAVAYVIEEAKKNKRDVHFCHISLRSDLEQIIKAKKMNVGVTCGVTPHHLFLNERDGEKLGSYGRMKPFLKSQKDVDFFWENLEWIDVIESDHAPHTKNEKDGNNPPFGVPGLETTLPLLLTAVGDKRMSIEDIIRLCHAGPAKIFHLATKDAIVEVDMDEEFIVENKELKTKCAWSPFANWTLKGKVKKVSIRGKVVYENNKILVKKGFGKIVYPENI